jgi:hypothetical protein
MFPANMPWPVSLAPMMKVLDVKIIQKNLMIKSYRHDPGGHVKCKDSITIIKCNVLVRIGENSLYGESLYYYN